MLWGCQSEPGSKGQGSRWSESLSSRRTWEISRHTSRGNHTCIAFSYFAGLQKISDCRYNVSKSIWMLIWLLPAVLKSYRLSLFYCTFVYLKEASVKQPAGINWRKTFCKHMHMTNVPTHPPFFPPAAGCYIITERFWSGNISPSDIRLANVAKNNNNKKSRL